MNHNKFLALIIMDGFGVAPEAENNAISEGTAPFYYSLIKSNPNTILDASGLAVGLPDGQMGNSEVGHLNIGAGRIIYQELTRITKSIQCGDFFENESLLKAVRHAKEKNQALHLLGLLSDGGVHSDIQHLYALLRLAKKEGLKKVFIHCLLDGRDVPPMSGKEYIKKLEEQITNIGVGRIATIAGRYYTMDRDNIWERVEKGYSAMADGKGVIEHDAVKAVQNSYDNNITDEFVLPTVICDQNNEPVGEIKKEDSLIFFNFRPDRARQITKAFIDKDFHGFNREKGFLSLEFVSFTQYDVNYNKMLSVAYRPESYSNTLGEYLSKLNIKQLRIAETQKYAHVTFFLNGGVEKANEGEERVLIPSSKVATFDLEPEMRAREVCDRAISEIKNGTYGCMILNFANCDMVGHTGVFEAAQKAVRVTDECVEKLVKAIKEIGGNVLITADHGNCDIMYDLETKEPFTAHTTNPVPLILAGSDINYKFVSQGKLSDIAPTMLYLMGLEIPKEMTGKVLLERN